MFNGETSLFSGEIALGSFDLPNNVGNSSIELDLSVHTFWVIDNWSCMMSLDVSADYLDHKLEGAFPRREAGAL